MSDIVIHYIISREPWAPDEVPEPPVTGMITAADPAAVIGAITDVIAPQYQRRSVGAAAGGRRADIAVRTSGPDCDFVVDVRAWCPDDATATDVARAALTQLWVKPARQLPRADDVVVVSGDGRPRTAAAMTAADVSKKLADIGGQITVSRGLWLPGSAVVWAAGCPVACVTAGNSSLDATIGTAAALAAAAIT